MHETDQNFFTLPSDSFDMQSSSSSTIMDEEPDIINDIQSCSSSTLLDNDIDITPNIQSNKRLRSPSSDIDSNNDFLSIHLKRQKQEQEDEELARKLTEEWSKENLSDKNPILENQQKLQIEQDEKLARQLFEQLQKEENDSLTVSKGFSPPIDHKSLYQSKLFQNDFNPLVANKDDMSIPTIKWENDHPLALFERKDGENCMSIPYIKGENNFIKGEEGMSIPFIKGEEHMSIREKEEDGEESKPTSSFKGKESILIKDEDDIPLSYIQGENNTKTYNKDQGVDIISLSSGTPTPRASPVDLTKDDLTNDMYKKSQDLVHSMPAMFKNSYETPRLDSSFPPSRPSKSLPSFQNTSLFHGGPSFHGSPSFQGTPSFQRPYAFQGTPSFQPSPFFQGIAPFHPPPLFPNIPSFQGTSRQPVTIESDSSGDNSETPMTDYFNENILGTGNSSLNSNGPFGMFDNPYENYLPYRYEPSNYGYSYGGKRVKQDEEEIKALFKDITADEEIMKTSELASSRVEGLRPSLMMHQSLGLRWMLKMENGRNHGGLLADEMGLGKTVQAIALIVSNKSDDPDCKTTLVVCPVSLVHQWAREITSKTEPRLKVIVWHGQNRTKSQIDLLEADVVITTYSLVAMEAPGRKKKKPSSNPVGEIIVDDSSGDEGEPRISFLTEMNFFRIILDESQWIKNRQTQSAKGCFRLKSKYRWCLSGTPIQNRVDEFFSVVHFMKIKPYHDWTKFRLDFSVPLKGYDQGASNRSLKKLRALLKAIMLRRTKDAKIDGKPILTLPEKKIEIITRAFSEDEMDFYRALETQSAMKVKKYLKDNEFTKNYANILVLLLRLRQACCHPWLIADRGVKLFSVSNDEESQIDFANLFDSKVVTRIKEMEKDNRIAIQDFECNICLDIVKDEHGPMLLYPCGHAFCSECIAGIVNASMAGPIDEFNEGPRCPTCRTNFQPERSVSYRAFSKAHNIGNSSDEKDSLKSDDEEEPNDLLAAVEKVFTTNSDTKGKGKEEELSVEELVKRAIENDNEWVSSTKIDLTVEIVKKIQTENNGEKVIIFSQFVKLLNLLAIPLDQNDIRFLRYDGSMNATSRADAICQFEDDPTINVMLVSLKAGNVGLNLTCANHCIVMDPFWNPFVVNQAIDRIHRIGQTRETNIYKMSIPGTVEDRILQLCDDKQNLVNAAFSEGESKGPSRLTQQEIMNLFDITSLDR